MGSIPRWLLRHRITIEPYTGEGPYGPVYGPPVTDVRAFVEAKRRRVLDDKGARVVADTTAYMRLAEVCPVRSRVTLPDGRKATVITHAPHDGGGLPTPDHLEVTLK